MPEDLLQTIDRVVERLSKPLREVDLSSGWREPSQQAMLKFFKDLRERISQGEELPYLGIVRALDHWGVLGGDLFRDCANIDHELRH